MSDGLSLYLRSLEGSRPLEHEAVVALAEAVQLGRAAQRRLDDGSARPDDRPVAERGRRAIEDLYVSNLRLVVSIARTYPPHPGSELADLIQAGNLGLWRAVELYDPGKGFRFSTYATKWIRQGIGRHLDKTSSALHLPLDVVARLRSALRVSGGDGSVLPDDLKGFEPGYRAASIDVPLGEIGSTMADLIPSSDEGVEELALRGVARSALLELVEQLGEPHSTAVIMRFGLDGRPPSANAQIGAVLRCRRSTVPTILDDAIERLRLDRGVVELAGATA